MSFYYDQAQQFLEAAEALQTRLTNEGSTLDNAAYTSLGKQRDALLDQANAMIAADLKGTLAQLKLDQPRLAKCTASLNAAVKTLKRFDRVAAIVTAAVSLATAIACADPAAIVAAIAGAEKAITGTPVAPTSPNPAAPGTLPGTAVS
jgi:hypothetical protein